MNNYRKILMFFLLVIMAGIHASPVSPGANASGSTDRLMGKLNCSGPIRSTPVNARETIYIGSDNGYLFAISRKTSTVRWVFRADDPIASKPAVQGDFVFFSTRRGTLYAVYQHQHQQEGKEAWRFTSQARTMKIACPQNSPKF